jgi:single-stranded-DNA-specific exonuclease
LIAPMTMKWVLAGPEEGVVEMLSRGAGLHPLVARLMVIRGINDPGRARSFLACELSALSAPRALRGMDKAVERIHSAISDGQKITVYGDYDVDGVTGAALLYLTLRELGADAGCYLPDRMSEGYGLHAAALGKIRESGARLVITVDCGITAFEAAKSAGGLGLDLIITDHHEFAADPKRAALKPTGDVSAGASPADGSDSGAVLPEAYAVLHPLLLAGEASGETRREVAVLTGVGIAFKLAQALIDGAADDERLCSCLDLVTLGTVADVGSITGENRVMVRHGLDLLSKARRPGLVALNRVSGLDGKKIGVGAVAFSLAPRINASGRLQRADAAFRLLTTDSPTEADELAEALEAVNKERRSVELEIREQAREQCRGLDAAGSGALVLSSGAWHPGVIGIVASRLVDEFYRPVALISVRDGVGKGSARSVPGFDLYAGLCDCSDLLLGFGGHRCAAGFTIAEGNIPAFRERLNAVALKSAGPQGFVRSLVVDGAVSLGTLTEDLMLEVARLGPFGQGNPEPRLGARGLRVNGARIVGINHLKCAFRQDDGPTVSAIAFNRGGWLGREIRDGARVAAVFVPRLNAWKGAVTVELELKDVKVDK